MEVRCLVRCDVSRKIIDHPLFGQWTTWRKQRFDEKMYDNLLSPHPDCRVYPSCLEDGIGSDAIKRRESWHCPFRSRPLGRSVRMWFLYSQLWLFLPRPRKSPVPLTIYKTLAISESLWLAAAAPSTCVFHFLCKMRSCSLNSLDISEREIKKLKFETVRNIASSRSGLLKVSWNT